MAVERDRFKGRVNGGQSVARPVARPVVRPAAQSPGTNTIRVSAPIIESAAKPSKRRLSGSKDWHKYTFRPSKRVVIIGGAVVLVLALILAVVVNMTHRSATLKQPLITDGQGNSSSRSQVVSAAVAQPPFTPLVPQSKPQLGKATAGVSYFDNKKGNYSYTDKLQGQSILVSEQAIPKPFKTEAEAVATISKQLTGKQAVPVGSGESAYVSTNPKSNSQTVVFAKNSLLIFVQSPFTHTTAEWSTYLKSLK